LEYLWGSERKLRLFACACIRRMWPLLDDGPLREAIETVEARPKQESIPRGLRWAAQGAATAVSSQLARKARDRELRARTAAAGAVCALLDCSPASNFAAGAQLADVRASEARVAAVRVTEQVSLAAKFSPLVGGDSGRPRAKFERGEQCRLVREIFRNPFRRATAADSSWQAWNSGTVRRLAESAYDERQSPDGTLHPHRLGLVADALEDSGCDDPNLSAHLRSPGPHVRGCWAVDLVLAKE
jgi:hypothetical protein